MRQPNPKKNNHPDIADLILLDLETNGEHLPQNDAFAELYGAACKVGIFLKAAKDQIGDGQVLKESLIEDIKNRKALGLEKYGVALQAFNGRDAAQDAYEEALDLVFYLRQKVYEIQNENLKTAS